MDKEVSTYKLPEGWVWATVGDIGIVISGGTPSTRNPKFWGDDIPWITPADLSNYNEMYISKGLRCISKEGLDFSSAKLIPRRSILFSSRAPIGYVAIAKNDLTTNQGFKNLVITNSLSSEFVYYYFKTIKALAEKMASGTTFLELSATKFSQIPIPLPPLNEQSRIVSKIEELFSELDHAKKGLEKAKRQLEVFRQSLLKRAFEGKLTNKIIEKGRLPKEWKWIKVSEICNVVRGGSPRPAGDSRYYNGHIPFLKVKDITKDNKVYLNSYEFTIKEAGLAKTRKISPNTLLLSNSGATLGVPKICTIEATMNDGIAAFLDLDKRSIHYLYYFWLSKTRELRNINMGAAQPNLNTDIIKNYDLPYCSFDEQQLIVQAIESRFSLIENLVDSINIGLKKVEAFRHSILKKTFEGKLVPQDSNDGSATRLLKQIQYEKAIYSNVQKELVKQKPKNTRTMENYKKVLEILKEKGKPISAKELWQLSIHKDNIDAFYAQLKEHIEKGEIEEIERRGKDSFLKLTDSK
jgi:type I restriction enzyme, S subunit